MRRSSNFAVLTRVLTAYSVVFRLQYRFQAKQRFRFCLFVFARENRGLSLVFERSKIRGKMWFSDNSRDIALFLSKIRSVVWLSLKSGLVVLRQNYDYQGEKERETETDRQ